MEHVRARDDSSSPHPTENPATPLIQADPSVLTPNRREFDTEYPAWPSPPSTASSRYTDKSLFSGLSSLHSKLADLKFEPPRSKPLFRGFERPSPPRIAILTVLCLITYPAFYVLTLVAKDKSLFVVRLIVSIWCSVVGFALGYILLTIGAQHLEAASESVVMWVPRESETLFQTAWATAIHMSYEGGGMKLRDLARTSRNPTSFISALHIFRSRFGNRVTSRCSRKSNESVPRSSFARVFSHCCSKRPWSLFLAFFVVLAVLGPLLPFLFGRVIDIKTFVSVRATHPLASFYLNF